jgi:hypothetical protein
MRSHTHEQEPIPVSTPLDISQSQRGNVLDWPDMPHPASALSEESE